MTDCSRFEAQLDSYVAGLLEEAELGPVLAHCRTCDECRRVLELHRDLTDLAARTSMPSEPELDRLQARVLVDLAGSARSGRGVPWVMRLVAALAAAVLLFAAGLGLGRSFGRPDDPAGRGLHLVPAIEADAAANRDLTDVADSPFTYSNVSFRRVDRDRVAVDFDVTTHVALVEDVASELVREVLVHSLLNPASTGTRLKAMSYAEQAMDPKVTDALVFAMHRDENLAVRLKALTLLSDHLDDSRVESAVLETLRDDASVQMRLLALEYLARHRVDDERIRGAVEASEGPGEEALRRRLADYENQL